MLVWTDRVRPVRLDRVAVEGLSKCSLREEGTSIVWTVDHPSASTSGRFPFRPMGSSTRAEAIALAIQAAEAVVAAVAALPVVP